MRVLTTADEARMLPLVYGETIPEAYLDIMGHMNVRYYVAIFDQAAWNMFALLGMDEQYYRSNQTGGFALRQFISYIAEVHVGEQVSVHARILGRSEKRIHFMLFMINDTRENVAATFEVLGSHADMRVRRTAPYLPEVAVRIDSMLVEHRALGWDAPVCGIIHP
jgi:acyl-CoA thioester hydrolase